jgi:GGDEF domain-containing protein
MISIKKFLEQRLNGTAPAGDVLDASLQMGRLLLDGVAAHMVRGRDTDFRVFGRTLQTLLHRLDEPPSSLRLLEIASEATEALETYAQRTTGYLREQNEQMQSMVAMLTETLADVSGQTDVSVARLQAIEQQIERTSGLDDMRALTTSLESCLAAVREAAAQQRKGAAATVQRLRDQIDAAEKRMRPDQAPSRWSQAEIDLVAEPSADRFEETASAYVAAFKLQRAEHIAARFGESTKHQMLALISQSLKSVLGPNDRLLRWKGTSFVMFLNSTAPLHEIRVQLSEAVARSGQHYVEVGKKAALLSVGVDWVVFPQAQCPSLDAVFTEVDAFLAGEIAGMGAAGALRTASPLQEISA